MINETTENDLEIHNTNIFTNNNNPISSYNDMLECPICLTEINQNSPILIVDCCHKKIHLDCIIQWYSKYPDNKTCFMCNQSNSFCKDFVYSNENSNDNSNENSNEDIDDQSINDLNHSVLIPMPTPINTRYPKIVNCAIITITFIMLIGVCIFITQIFNSN